MVNKDLNKISISSKEITNEWHLIDANDQVLGRIATQIAMKLMGKEKVNYAPNLATGDFVVVINSKGVKLTGKKDIQKEYFKHSGYPGGEKLIKFQEMMEKDSNEVIINAVKGMLPKIIKILATISIFELLKKPIDSLCVEKPPVAIVVIEWLTLSNIDIPKIQ